MALSPLSTGISLTICPGHTAGPANIPTIMSDISILFIRTYLKYLVNATKLSDSKYTQLILSTFLEIGK